MKILVKGKAWDSRHLLCPTGAPEGLLLNPGSSLGAGMGALGVGLCLGAGMGALDAGLSLGALGAFQASASSGAPIPEVSKEVAPGW